MEYGCIGEHLTHSFSQEIHNLLAEYTYQLVEVEPQTLNEFMQKREFKAINVTIPYKQAVIPHLSYIDPKAETIHAVNTIVNRQGSLYGYNTDYYGMCSLIARNGVSLSGKKVVILGTGGTSLTAREIAKDQNAKQVLRVSRTPTQQNTISYDELLCRHTDAQIIINTTPVGMFPNPDGMPVDPTLFPRLEGVIDAIYNPLRSRLVLKARQLGIPAQGGLYMLVAQAAKAVEHFLDTTLPEHATNEVYNTLVHQKENIVLTGMPGSGKTTVGKLVAQQLGRTFVDMDDEIIKIIGCPIADFFQQYGEEAFRDIETKVTKEVIAPQTGLVVATGGGAVLKEENVNYLRLNGRLYFIDRPLAQLCATDDRPTANSREAMEKRYEERYERYCSTADCHIASNGIAPQVAEQIAKEFVQ